MFHICLSVDYGWFHLVAVLDCQAFICKCLIKLLEFRYLAKALNSNYKLLIKFFSLSSKPAKQCRQGGLGSFTNNQRTDAAAISFYGSSKLAKPVQTKLSLKKNDLLIISQQKISHFCNLIPIVKTLQGKDLDVKDKDE